MKKLILALAILFIGTSLSAQEKYDKHIFSMNTGYAFRFADSHPQQLINTTDNPDHVKRMRHCLNFGFSYDYRFSKYFSAGLNSSMLMGFHSFEKEVVSQNTTTIKLYSDDINIFYVGPTFKAQLPTIAEKIDLWTRATLGYMNTRITDKTEGSNIFSGNCLGYGIEIGADYIISDHIGINLGVEYLGGQINTFKSGEDEIDISENPENLSRLNVKLGVVIKL